MITLQIFIDISGNNCAIINYFDDFAGDLLSLVLDSNAAILSVEKVRFFLSLVLACNTYFPTQCIILKSPLQDIAEQ